jgi:hypothetical protein
MIATNPDSEQPEQLRDAPRAPARGSRTRPLVMGMAIGLGAALAAIAAVLYLTREGKERLTAEAYEAAVARWEQNGPRDYTIDLELEGNRPGKVHVEVRAGEVARMTRDGVEPKQKRTCDYWSVPGQLETIGQELEMARDPAASFKSRAVTQMIQWADFDPHYGYPRSYDRVVLGGDYEVHWKVTNFVDLSQEK